MIISGSEIDAIALCEMLHYYSYGEKIQAKGNSKPLAIGNLGHAALSAFFKARKTGLGYDAALGALEEFFAKAFSTHDGEIVGICYRVTLQFLEDTRDRIEQWDIIEVEKENRLEFPEFTFAFTIDLEFMERGLVQILDWKYVYNFYDADTVNLLPQIPRYVGARRAMGRPVAGGYYGFIRYREVKEALKHLITPVPLTNEKIKNAFRQVDKRYVRIRELKSSINLDAWKDSADRLQVGHVCKRCNFKEPCAIEASGENAALVKRLNFEQNTYGYKETDQ